MGSRTLFSLKVIRCPACHARLPVVGAETLVTCEYCDARVELRKAPPARPPQLPSPYAPNHHEQVTPTATHFAKPHYSGLAWLALITPMLGVLGTAIAVLISTGAGMPWDGLRRRFDAPPREVAVAPGRTVVPAHETVHSKPPERDAPSSAASSGPSTAVAEPESGRVGRFFADLNAQAEASKTTKTGKRPSPPPAKPSGPLLSVAEAKTSLQPEIAKCVKTARVHRVAARMGNKTEGGVAILETASVAKPRVDGVVVAKLSSTPLGRCINEAGKHVRTQAFQGNYMIIDVRNPDVADPLANLPVRPTRDAIDAVVAPYDPEVRTCAKKHGETGKRVRIQLRIDGPTGKLVSARPTYTKRGFDRCLESLYQSIRFPRAQTENIDHSHTIDL